MGCSASTHDRKVKQAGKVIAEWIAKLAGLFE